MGFLDRISDVVSSLADDDDQNRSMLDGVVDIFKRGGLNSVVDSFKEKGLGETISSWIGSGQNMPVSSDQLRDGLGSDKLKELAQRAGVSEERASGFLQNILPDIIDKITPSGKIEDD